MWVFGGLYGVGDVILGGVVDYGVLIRWTRRGEKCYENVTIVANHPPLP